MARRLPTLPDRDGEALLEVLLGDRERSRSAWRRWRSGRPDLAIDPASERLLPMLYRRLAELDLDPGRLGPRLAGAYRASFSRNQLLQLEASAMARTLAGAGIPAMLIKGGAMQWTVYEDRGMRPMADIDMLIPPERAAEACSILEGSEWRSAAEDLAPLLAGGYHAQFSRRGGLVVELHWYSRSQSGSDHGLWERAGEIEIGEVSTPVPSRADQLLASCVHAVEWAPSHRLLWVVDGSRLIGAEQGVDWDQLLESAIEGRVSSYMEPTLGYLRERWRMPVPGRVISQLGRAHRPRHELIGLRAATSRTGPLTACRAAWDRSRRLAALDRSGLPPPSYLQVLRSLWGPRSWSEMVADAFRSLGRRLGVGGNPS